MKATDENGLLARIPNCYIQIPNRSYQLLGFRIDTHTVLIPRILPEISDSKSVTYTDEIGIGRSFPMKTFSHADNRVFSVRWHFIILDDTTRTEAVNGLRAIQSCVYPGTEGIVGAPYTPPGICKLKCGRLFATGGDEEICAVMRRYSVSYPTDVAWDEETYLPYKFSVEMEWEAVFATSNLPGREKIIP